MKKYYCLSPLYRIFGDAILALGIWGAYFLVRGLSEGTLIITRLIVYILGTIMFIVLYFIAVHEFPVVKVTESGLEFGVFRKVRIAWDEISCVGYSMPKTKEQKEAIVPGWYLPNLIYVLGPSTPYFREMCETEYAFELFFIYRFERYKLFHMLPIDWLTTVSKQVLDETQLPEKMVVLPPDVVLMAELKEKVRMNGNISVQ